ncbi:MAG: nitrous oxide reductase family maturation protein NosD, partial [Halobacteria archaeon]|nr:nitrous oxide reductase family maturation protein NosD [Halobacteria archaeon]
WNASAKGNYWSGARTVDMNNDGVSEVRYKPSGFVEYMMRKHPQAAVFANSPAFDAVRMAESSFPVIRSPGIVDYHPLTKPPHENWRKYYGK